MNHGNDSVSVTGNNVVKAIKGFDDACFSPLLKKNLIDAGYKIPTPVQKHAIPIIMAGRDLMASALPGSGKTAAFLLPIINRLIYSSGVPPATPQVLVITRNNKIAIQTYNEVMKFTKDSAIITEVDHLLGGYKDYDLHDMCHILVTTKPRFLNQIYRTVMYKNLDVLVLYETESILSILDMEWMDDSFMARNEKRQTLAFSTSFDDHIQCAAMNILNNYLFLTVAKVPSVEDPDTAAPDEENYAAMSEWKNTVDRQMTSLMNNLEQLSITVQELQTKNHLLQQNMNDLQRKNNLLEEKLSADTRGHTIDNTPPDNGTGAITKENMLQLLTSCESFQRQAKLFVSTEIENGKNFKQ